MGKPALGRGLGQLLDVGKSPPTFLMPGKPLTSGKPGPSLTVAPERSPQARPEPARKGFLLPAWFCFGSDLVLLGFATAIVFVTPAPLPLSSLLMASACTLLGCGMGLLGVAAAEEVKAPR